MNPSGEMRNRAPSLLPPDKPPVLAGEGTALPSDPTHVGAQSAKMKEEMMN